MIPSLCQIFTFYAQRPPGANQSFQRGKHATYYALQRTYSAHCEAHQHVSTSPPAPPQLSWASTQPGGLRVRLGFFDIAELGELLREPCRRAGLACRHREADGWHEVVIARPGVAS